MAGLSSTGKGVRFYALTLRPYITPLLYSSPIETSTMARKDIRTISICCAGCKTLLYKYRKGGRGRLVKCVLDRIDEDHTHGDMRCPKCGRAFARFKMYGGQAAHKIIQGKVFTKGQGRR